jgi:hypothetical protein
MADPLDGRIGETWAGEAANGRPITMAIAIVRRSLVPAAGPSRDAMLSLVARREGARDAFDAGE